MNKKIFIAELIIFFATGTIASLLYYLTSKSEIEQSQDYSFIFIMFLASTSVFVVPKILKLLNIK